MLNALNIFVIVFGGAASLLEFYLFFQEKVRHRYWIAGVCLTLAGLSFLLYYVADRQATVAELERRAAAEQARIERQLIQDAKQVSSTIIPTGWDDSGDHLGYLAMVAGFYQRHADRYKTESETYSRQLSEWQEFLKAARQSGKQLTVDQEQELSGLVASADQNLMKIGAGEH